MGRFIVFLILRLPLGGLISPRLPPYGRHGGLLSVEQTDEGQRRICYTPHSPKLCLVTSHFPKKGEGYKHCIIKAPLSKRAKPLTLQAFAERCRSRALSSTPAASLLCVNEQRRTQMKPRDVPLSKRATPLKNGDAQRGIAILQKDNFMKKSVNNSMRKTIILRLSFRNFPFFLPQLPRPYLPLSRLFRFFPQTLRPRVRRPSDKRLAYRI